MGHDTSLNNDAGSGESLASTLKMIVGPILNVFTAMNHGKFNSFRILTFAALSLAYVFS